MAAGKVDQQGGDGVHLLANAHGGQESTILALNNTFYHWGAIVLPLGYTVSEVFNGGGNPYGASYTSGTRVGEPDPTPAPSRPPRAVDWHGSPG